MSPFSSVLILGKELRLDPDRGLRELHARSAAAATAFAHGASRIYTLEARLRGQQDSGSAIVLAQLAQLEVPTEAIYAEDLTCSTREEVARLAQLAPLGPVLLLTASYHIARTRRLVAEAGLQASVHAPEALLHLAQPLAREWMLAGIPTPETMEFEGRREAVLSLAETLVRPLPYLLRTRIETHAGRLFRGG